MLFGCLHRQLSLEWLRWSCPWLTTPNVPKPASSCPRGVLMPRCLRPGLQLGSGRFVVWMYPTLDRVSDGHAASFPAVWAIHAVIPVTVWFLPPVVGVFIISVQGLKLEVTQIIGPVVDVQLKSSVPAWRIPTPVRVAQSIRAGHVTVEVQHLLGGGIFRSVAMQGTQGLRRGDPAELLPGLGSAVCLTAFSLVGFIGGIVHGYTRRVHDPRLRWHKNLLTLVTHQTGKLIGIRR